MKFEEVMPDMEFEVTWPTDEVLDKHLHDTYEWAAWAQDNKGMVGNLLLVPNDRCKFQGLEGTLIGLIGVGPASHFQEMLYTGVLMYRGGALKQPKCKEICGKWTNHGRSECQKCGTPTQKLWLFTSITDICPVCKR